MDSGGEFNLLSAAPADSFGDLSKVSNDNSNFLPIVQGMSTQTKSWFARKTSDDAGKGTRGEAD
jgi:hypothetical protein